MKDYGLIGKNLKHTISPFIHKELFSFSGQNYGYEVYDIEESELNKGKEIYNLKGFNVTIPYKKTVLKYLDETDEKVALYGAVNTVKNENGIIKGYNTDGYGFLKGLSEICDDEIKSALVLGAGGAASVVAAELSLLKIPVTLAVRSSSAQKAFEISKRLLLFALKECSVTDINDIGGKYDLIVNCTPIGTYPDDKALPIRKEAVLNSRYVYDLVYNPYKTALVKLAESNSVKAVNGLTMLIYQAAKAQNIWLGNKFDDCIINKIKEKSKTFLEERFI